MNPVDQRSEFCRPETAKSVDQRSTAGDSVPAGFSKFSNFAGEFSLRISLRIPKMTLCTYKLYKAYFNYDLICVK